MNGWFFRWAESVILTTEAGARRVVAWVREAPLTGREWAQLFGATVLPLVYVISRL